MTRLHSVAWDVRSRYAPLLAAIGCWAWLNSAAFAQDCVGDCDANAKVSVAELVLCVNIALGDRPAADCSPCDASGGGAVKIDGLIQAVSSALSGCFIPFVPSASLYPGRKFRDGAFPFSVTVADLNADDLTDLVVANAGLCVSPSLCPAGDVSVFLGVRDGVYSGARRYTAGKDPVSVAVADLNADSLPDLVTANRGSADVSVLLGVGGGTFAAEQRYSMNFSPTSVAVADLNADNVPDLVAATNGGVSVLLGVGDGTLDAEQVWGVEGSGFPGRVFSVAVADLNADNVPDLVAATNGGVSVLLGVGDGTFEPEQRRYKAGEQPVSVIVVDLDSNGIPDLVAAYAPFCDFDRCPLGGGVSVLLGVGDGTFGTERRYDAGQGPPSLWTAGLLRSPHSVAAADLNADGTPDLVTATLDGVSVLLGVGDGTFSTRQLCHVGRALSLAVTDLNADHVPDLVTANLGPGVGQDPAAGPGHLSVLPGVGDGTFNSAQRYSAGQHPQSVVVADLNADDQPDLVTANGGSDDVSVLLGAGDGTFGTEQRYTAGDVPVSIAVADLNADHVPDLVTANGSDDVSVLLGVGDGTFATEQRYTAGQDPQSVAVADLNADRIPDLVTANGGSDDVSVLLGVGDGTFPAEQRYTAGDVPVSVAVADLNADHVPDLVTANQSGGLSVLLGVGDGGLSAPLGVGEGTFPTGPRFSAHETPVSVAVADLDSDGVPDLVTANGSYDVSVFLGVGDGTFPTEQRYTAGDAPVSVTVADLNADGVTDIVTANGGFRGSDDVSVLLALPRPVQNP